MSDASPFASYNTNSFTFAFWTRGRPHMLQLLTDFSNGRYCLEFTTYEVTWFHDHTTGSYYDLRPTSGASIRKEDWALRAFSLNGTHLCTFLSGESVCTHAPSARCDRVHSVYVAPMGRGSEYMHSMAFSPLRVFSPALSPAALTQMYYNEKTSYVQHISGPLMNDAQEAARLPLQQL